MRFLLLALAGAVYGFLGGALFRRVHLRGEINRILAHVLSFRLFIDEPVLVFRAQVELLRENLRVLRKVALPGVVMAIVFVLSFGTLDRYFGRGELPAGRPMVITAPDEIALPAEIVAESPAVRIPRLHEVSWRVHVAPGFSGGLPAGLQARYPRARIFGAEWWLWFFAFSGAGATALYSVRYERSAVFCPDAVRREERR